MDMRVVVNIKDNKFKLEMAL